MALGSQEQKHGFEYACERVPQRTGGVWKPEDYGVKSREFRSSETCRRGGEDDRSTTGKVVIPGEVT
ncbi:hypothetical protein AV530_018579 [Patagioenas fasciata monilis]|uniref:Uncharacterized protein n=1 Tax=Patagioenas fasciata monilis TaxID=372326 RepID=A0A1V4JSH2_PATFA|nr:hypothetical protein AV530_018579 [Patagioenas fasciata monilis]